MMATLHLGWPQVIYILLWLLTLGVTIDKAGEPKGVYSVGGHMLNAIVCFGLLYWGGFFSA
jgi:hypothetical protein